MTELLSTDPDLNRMPTDQDLARLQFTTLLSEDNKPCIGVGYNVMPVPEYYSFR